MNKIRDVDKSEFIGNWAATQGSDDPTAMNLLDLHRSSSFIYSEVEVTRESLDHIVLASHNHGPTGVPGEAEILSAYGKRVTSLILDHNLSNECTTRIRSVISYFETKGNGDGYVRGVHMFLTPNPELSIQKSYPILGPDPLYTGSFHQFAAYIAFVETNGFIPLRLFMAVKSSNGSAR